jgi:hypothetical protein
MRTYRGIEAVLHALNLGSRERSVVSFKAPPLYLGKIDPETL